MLLFVIRPFVLIYIKLRFKNIYNLYRYLHAHNNRKLLLSSFEYLLRKNNSWIGIQAEIKSEPIFPHGISGIFISHQAKIGKNVTIYQQVTIGSNSDKLSTYYGSPTIGDNCYIGAGAKIIGRCTIGNNCKLGANVVVVRDIPENCTVVNAANRIINLKENV